MPGLVWETSSFVATRFLTHIFCCAPKTASVEGALYALGQIWVLVPEVVSARWPVPGWGSHVGSHGPDPGLAGCKETSQGAGDTWACVKAKPKPENIPPTPPAVSLQRVFCLGGRPCACSAVFQVFPGSEPLTSCKPGFSPLGWYLK